MLKCYITKMPSVERIWVARELLKKVANQRNQSNVHFASSKVLDKYEDELKTTITSAIYGDYWLRKVVASMLITLNYETPLILLFPYTIEQAPQGA